MPVAPAPPFNPTQHRCRMVWAPPLSLAATQGISFDFSSCRYLDGSLPCVSPQSAYFIQRLMAVIQTTGLPHSDTCGSSVVGTSPQLFAAIRVLRRLAAPRHPPWTLLHLTILSFRFLRYNFQKSLEAQGLEPWTLGLQSRCSSQLSHAPMPSWAIGKRETPSRPYIAGPSPAGATLLFSAPPAVSPMALPFFLERR